MPESEIGIWQQPALPLSVCFVSVFCTVVSRAEKIHGVHPTWNPAGNWGNHMYGIGGVLGICTGAGSNVG